MTVSLAPRLVLVDQTRFRVMNCWSFLTSWNDQIICYGLVMRADFFSLVFSLPGLHKENHPYDLLQLSLALPSLLSQMSGNLDLD